MDIMPHLVFLYEENKKLENEIRKLENFKDYQN